MDRGRTRIAKTRLDKTIGTNIRNQRIIRDMTRDELAAIIDLTVSHLGLIERGERGATPVTLEKIVRAFGITIDKLFKEPGNLTLTRKQFKHEPDTYFKKVSSQLTCLTEQELEILSHTITGLMKVRPNNSSTNEANDELDI